MAGRPSSTDLDLQIAIYEYVLASATTPVPGRALVIDSADMQETGVTLCVGEKDQIVLVTRVGPGAGRWSEICIYGNYGIYYDHRADRVVECQVHKPGGGRCRYIIRTGAMAARGFLLSGPVEVMNDIMAYHSESA